MKLSPLLLPILVVLALFGGYGLRAAFTQPTTRTAVGVTSGESCTAIVTGLKCKGTAAFFTSLYDSIPGIQSIETYATEHKAIFSYDPNLITRDSIKAIMEQVITFDDGTSSQVFECQSLE
jgi:hypothetical protein